MHPTRLRRIVLGLLVALAVGLVTVPGAHAAPVPSSGHPRDARLTIPAIGIHRLPVIAYRGTAAGPTTVRAPGSRTAASRRRRTAATAGSDRAGSGTTR